MPLEVGMGDESVVHIEESSSSILQMMESLAIHLQTLCQATKNKIWMNGHTILLYTHMYGVKIGIQSTFTKFIGLL